MSDRSMEKAELLNQPICRHKTDLVGIRNRQQRDKIIAIAVIVHLDKGVRTALLSLNPSVAKWIASDITKASE